MSRAASTSNHQTQPARSSSYTLISLWDFADGFFRCLQCFVSASSFEAALPIVVAAAADSFVSGDPCLYVGLKGFVAGFESAVDSEPVIYSVFHEAVDDREPVDAVDHEIAVVHSVDHEIAVVQSVDHAIVVDAAVQEIVVEDSADH